MNLREAAQQALEALVIAEAALADIGDADREPGDDLAWCEARAAQALEAPRTAITAVRAALEQPEQPKQDCPHGADGACKECYLLRSQNTELDRTLCEMEHALNEADAIMDEDQEAYEWRKRWGYLWGRKV